MDGLLLTNGNVFNGYEFIGCKDILIEEGRIINIDDKINSDYRKIDLKGYYICPGFIDIHIHGACGCDFTNADEDNLKKISSFLAVHGTTSFLATALTAGNEKIRACLKNIKEFQSIGYKGANVLGVHLEGPFINEKKKGGLNERYIQKPTIDNYRNIVCGYEGIIKTITLAPEVPGAYELIAYLRNEGVKISIGHSVATYDETIQAVECGVNRGTHIFNGMNALDHKEPGIVGGLLDSKGVFVEMIADLLHLHPAIVRLLINSKGIGRCITISDAVEPTGMEDGEYEIGGKMVIVKDGAARLKENAALCGSTITLDQGLKNIVAIGVELEDALKTVTSNPAKAIGVDGNKGEIKSGYDADIVVLNNNLEVAFTMINGVMIAE